MILVRKIEGKIVKAYELGVPHPVLTQLAAEGKLVDHGDGTYEIFSQETTSKGQIARTGDYIKIDSAGFPYPNSREFFLANHRKLPGENCYEQIPQTLEAWTTDCPICEKIRFLMREKELQLNPQTPDAYFSAPLWGTRETANADSILVFYRIDRDENGTILDADFNFVRKEEFDKTYTIIK